MLCLGVVEGEVEECLDGKFLTRGIVVGSYVPDVKSWMRLRVVFVTVDSVLILRKEEKPGRS